MDQLDDWAGLTLAERAVKLEAIFPGVEIKAREISRGFALTNIKKKKVSCYKVS